MTIREVSLYARYMRSDWRVAGGIVTFVFIGSLVVGSFVHTGSRALADDYSNSNYYMNNSTSSGGYGATDYDDGYHHGMPGGTPTPSTYPSPSPTPSHSPWPTWTPTPKPTHSPTPTPCPSKTPYPSPTPSPKPTWTPSPSPQPTYSPWPTDMPQPSSTATASAVANATVTINENVATPSVTPMPTGSPLTNNVVSLPETGTDGSAVVDSFGIGGLIIAGSAYVNSRRDLLRAFFGHS